MTADGPRGPVRGLLVGYGSIGRRHLANLSALGVTDWAVVHTGRGTLPFEPPVPVRVHGSLPDALANERPTFAVVANPTALHAATALECARHGCDLLIEKPVSHSLERLEALADAAAAGGNRVLVGYQFRFDPGLRRVGELLRAGTLGAPVHARVVWGEHLPEWHPWEDWRTSYAARRDLGGGVHHTLSHPLDYLRMLLGEPTTVAATLVDHGPLGLDVAEAADITLRFGAGPSAQVHLDYWQRPATHRLEVVCTDGTITWDHRRGRLEVHDARTGAEAVETCPGADARDELFRAEARHFLDVVARRAQPACTLHDGIRAVVLCDAVERAAAGTATIVPEAP